MDKAKMIQKGMDSFAKRIEKKKKLYLKLLKLSEQSKGKIFKIASTALFNDVMKTFGAALDNRKAKAGLKDIYEAAIHKETGSLIICNKGATLYSLSPKTDTPYITRHIGFCVYVPGLGIEFANVGLVGDVYNGKVVLRSESACTPSFLFGSQRCNCAYQWDSIRELAAHYNRISPPELKTGHEFENWVQKQFVYDGKRHIAKNSGPGFILMHIDTQNGMGSGYSEGEFAFDLFSRASIRHRGEYSSEQVKGTTMWGGFEAIGISPDPRRENGNLGYKITFILLDYLKTSKDLISLTNNPLKMCQLKNNGYSLTRVKSLGAVNLAGSQEAEQRGSEFKHLDINGDCVTFEEEHERLKLDIGSALRKKDSYITFECVSRCNMDCKFCFSKWRDSISELSTEKAKESISLLRNSGFSAINFTGGEPLLRKDLPELLAWSRKLGMTTILTTNGILLKGILPRIAKDLDFIGLPLDSCIPEVHNHLRTTDATPNHHNIILKMIDEVNRNYPHIGIKINTLVSRKNKGSISGIGDLIKGKVVSWKLSHFIDAGHGKKFSKEFSINSEEYWRVSRKCKSENAGLNIISSAAHSRDALCRILSCNGHILKPAVNGLEDKGEICSKAFEGFDRRMNNSFYWLTYKEAKCKAGS
ncbi:MAG: radical SAM protein [Candidatus Woesearchaeota archaeon]